MGTQNLASPSPGGGAGILTMGSSVRVLGRGPQFDQGRSPEPPPCLSSPVRPSGGSAYASASHHGVISPVFQFVPISSFSSLENIFLAEDRITSGGEKDHFSPFLDDRCTICPQLIPVWLSAPWHKIRQDSFGHPALFLPLLLREGCPPALPRTGDTSARPLQRRLLLLSLTCPFVIGGY